MHLHRYFIEFISMALVTLSTTTKLFLNCIEPHEAEILIAHQ